MSNLKLNPGDIRAELVRQLHAELGRIDRRLTDNLDRQVKDAIATLEDRAELAAPDARLVERSVWALSGQLNHNSSGYADGYGPSVQIAVDNYSTRLAGNEEGLKPLDPKKGYRVLVFVVEVVEHPGEVARAHS